MKTIEQIKDLMIGKSVIADLADLLRANDTDFAESEKTYYAAVEKLRAALPTEQTPTLDEYLSEEARYYDRSTRAARSSELSYNEANARELWEESARLVGLG